jgi:hypothetical protein
MHIARRQRIQLRLQLLVQGVDIADIEVVPEIPYAARSIGCVLSSPYSNAAAFALEIGVVAYM